MNEWKNTLTVGSVPKSLLHFFWPLLLANILQSMYSIADMLVVGRYVGDIGLAAISNASMIAFVVTSLSIGLGTGGTVCLAHTIGAGKRDRIKPTIDSMLTISLGMSLVVTVVLLSWLEPLLVLLDVPAAAMKSAYDYMVIVGIGTVFVFGFNAAGSLFRGMGDSRRPMHFIILATLVNIALDYLLVGYLLMGVRGAAYATVIAQAAACMAAWVSLHRENKEERLTFSLAEASPILKIGAASAVQLVVVNISYTIVTAMLNRYGVAVAAASGIGIKVNTLAAMPCWAFGYAVTAMVGQNLGAGKSGRARVVLYYGLIFAVAFSAVLVLFANILAEPIMMLFTPGNEEVARIGVQYIRLCCSVNCLVYCSMYIFDAFATGAGDAALAMVNSLLDSFVVRLALAWLLGVQLGYGYEGMYIAQALSPILPAVIGVAYFFRGRWKRHGIK